MGSLIVPVIDMGTLLIGGLIGHLVNIGTKPIAVGAEDPTPVKAALARFKAKADEFVAAVEKCC